MHTMAKVKNANLADGDTPEPAARVIGETQIVTAADRLIANTAEEADELVRHYHAEPGKVAVVHPGVNLDRFRPADGRAAARARLDLPQDALVPLFAGRIQPLKAPDVLLRAVAVLLDERPELRSRIVVPVVGGPSGSGLAKPEGLQKLAARLGIADVVRFRPPVGQDQLADWFRAASVLVVPSYSESFGLVAIEAQAAAPRSSRPRSAGSRWPYGTARRASWCRATIRPPTRVCSNVSPTAPNSPPGWARPPPRTPSPSAGTPRPPPPPTSTRPRPRPTAVAYAPSMGDVEKTAAQVIEGFLKDAELEWEAPAPGTYVVQLPGTRKLKTTVSLIVGRHSLSLNAFVIRHPDENESGVHRWLLERNLKLYGVSYAVDQLGDVYVTARLPSPWSPPTRSTASWARSWRPPTAPSTPSSSWASRAPSAGSTPGASPGASRHATWTRSRI